MKNIFQLKQVQLIIFSQVILLLITFFYRDFVGWWSLLNSLAATYFTTKYILRGQLNTTLILIVFLGTAIVTLLFNALIFGFNFDRF